MLSLPGRDLRQGGFRPALPGRRALAPDFPVSSLRVVRVLLCVDLIYVDLLAVDRFEAAGEAFEGDRHGDGFGIRPCFKADDQALTLFQVCQHGALCFGGTLTSALIAALQIEFELIGRFDLAADAGAKVDAEGNGDEHPQAPGLALARIADGDPDDLAFGLVVDHGLDQPADIFVGR